MHPRTAELLDHLAACHSESRAAFEAVPLARRTQEPAPGRWSAVQVVEHLAIVEQQVGGLLRRGLEAARAKATFPPLTSTDSVLATFDAAKVLDRERRITAIARVVPTGGLDAEQAWRTLSGERLAVVELVRSVDGLDTSAVKAPHFALGDLDFAQWVVFLGLHERRHAAQLRELAQLD